MNCCYSACNDLASKLRDDTNTLDVRHSKAARHGKAAAVLQSQDPMILVKKLNELRFSARIKQGTRRRDMRSRYRIGEPST
jgi:uncharacterized Zn ribbon protein